MKNVLRYEIYWVNLDPTLGSEIKKTRPAVVVSPNELNKHLNHIIVAPITKTQKDFPSRCPIMMGKIENDIVCEQVRTIDKQRIGKRIGKLSLPESKLLAKILVTIFEY